MNIASSVTSTSSSLASDASPSWWRRFSTPSSSLPPSPTALLSPPVPDPNDTFETKIAYLVRKGYAARAAAKQLAVHDGDVAAAEGRLAHRLHLKGVQPTLRRQGCAVCDERRRGKARGVGMSIREWRAAEAEAEAEAADDTDDDDDTDDGGLPLYADDYDYAPAYIVHKAEKLGVGAAHARGEREERIARLEALLAFYAPQLGDVSRISTAALVVPSEKA